MKIKSNDRNGRASALLEFSGRFLAVIAIFGLSACDTGSEDDVNNEKETESEPELEADAGVDGGEVEVEVPYTSALVVTTDYETGAYSSIKLDGYKVTKDIDFIHSDSVCHFDPVTNTPFIILRLGSDAVDVLDRETFDIEKEYSVEASSNPHDIAVISEKRAYISRYGDPEMLIVNPFSGKKLGTVDFSDYADDDGIPEVSGLVQRGDNVYASVQRLDRDNGWVAAGGGVIVVINAESGEIEGDVELTGTHVYGAPEYSKVVDKYVLAEPGSWADLEDSGLEYFDPEKESVSGFFITEEELGGNVTKGVVVSEEKGYALIGVQGENGNDAHVVVFNPKTGKKTDTLLAGVGWVYSDIAVTPDGTELWVADRTAEDDGIRIYNTETDEEKTDGPLNLGLPPSNICFTR